MKILLSYSKYHFDPSLPPAKQERWGSSANVLARSLHAILSEIGDVTYIDPSEYELVKGKSYDLFVGQVSNFLKIIRNSQIKKSIYFAVNLHPTKRNRTLLEFAQREGLPPEAIATGDLVDEKTYIKALNAADHIICLGTITAYNSYIEYGIPKQKIKLINYSTGPAVHDSSIKKVTSAKRHYLYLASDIGLRKGFDVVARQIARMAKKHGSNFHIDIIGLPTSKYHEQLLESLVTKYPQSVTNHGWVNGGSKAFDLLISKNDFYLFPSLEDAQAGTALDSMRRGLIPIISQNTAIDYSPFGWLDSNLPLTQQNKILEASFALSSQEIYELKLKTLEYYRAYHEPYMENLTTMIRDVAAGKCLYPKVSFTLPIFNKEKTIIPLLKYLNRAIKEYGNAELHIIFDGCKDKTVEKVMRFYRKSRGYEVTFEETANIFEVKTNNIGLKKSSGKYCVIVQDDNFIYDKNIVYEIVNLLDRVPGIAILGCLAGVNIYPRGTKGLVGKGQIMMSPQEVYWRQDEVTDPSLADKYFEVDACMRGPLVIRKNFLEKHGYLDEAYVPFYMDDMDLAMRAKKFGFHVYAMLSWVENKSLTIAAYSPAREKFWQDTIQKSTDVFYKRWKMSPDKDYLAVNRVQIIGSDAKLPNYTAWRARAGGFKRKVQNRFKLAAR